MGIPMGVRHREFPAGTSETMHLQNALAHTQNFLVDRPFSKDPTWDAIQGRPLRSGS